MNEQERERVRSELDRLRQRDRIRQEVTTAAVWVGGAGAVLVISSAVAGNGWAFFLGFVALGLSLFALERA